MNRPLAKPFPQTGLLDLGPGPSQEPTTKLSLAIMIALQGNSFKKLRTFALRQFEWPGERARSVVGDAAGQPAGWADPLADKSILRNPTLGVLGVRNALKRTAANPPPCPQGTERCDRNVLNDPPGSPIV